MEEIKLIITMDSNGKVNVNGPIQNKHLCYGMMELAKDAIREFHDRQRRVMPVVLNNLKPQ